VSAPPDPPAREEPPVTPAGDSSGKLDQLKVIGGLVALGSGLLALVIVVIVALLVKPDTTGGSIATSAIGVIGSIVGAYFGVKIGSDGTQKAIDAQQQEATKAQVFALHTPPGEAEQVLQRTQEMLASQAAAARRSAS
jgi:hypothetical protein